MSGIHNKRIGLHHSVRRYAEHKNADPLLSLV